MTKRIIFLIIAILVFGAGGFFWWQGREIKGNPEDYVIKETKEGKIIENKKAGLIVKVPEGWIEKKIEFLEGSIAIYTPNIEGKMEDEMIKPPLKKGCLIETSVIYREMNFDEIKKEVKELHAGLGIKSEEFEEVKINNRQALKNIFESKFLGPALVIYIPTKDKLFDFDLYWAPEEKENCVQEFDKFLETISIK